MSDFRLIQDDVATGCTGLPETSFDAVLCDPPYHLTTKYRGGGPTGFMEQAWDGGDVAFRPATWEAIARTLKPGAHLLTFGGTRTWHRLAVALEDAGLEIVDTLMWLYGQGWPKSLDISRVIKRAARAWDGYGTALKPAWEPVILARKPLDGTYAENVLTWGCGALNIDRCRIPTPKEGRSLRGGGGRLLSHRRDAKPDPGVSNNGYTPAPSGRFPANLLLDEESAAALDAQTGILKSGAMAAGTTRAIGNKVVYHGTKTVATRKGIQANVGGASRFFYAGKVRTGEREAGVPEGLNTHTTLKPLALTTYLATLLLPPERATPRRILVPFSGAGSEMIGALLAGWETVVGLEREELYIPIARARLRHWVPESTEDRDFDAEEGNPCPETG